jgi:hypothetical protein
MEIAVRRFEGAFCAAPMLRLEPATAVVRYIGPRAVGSPPARSRTNSSWK